MDDRECGHEDRKEYGKGLAWLVRVDKAVVLGNHDGGKVSQVRVLDVVDIENVVCLLACWTSWINHRAALYTARQHFFGGSADSAELCQRCKIP